MEELLQRAAKVSEQAELFKVVSEETPVQFEANRLKHIQSKQSASLALRLIKDGRIGYAATAGVDDSQELINMALETARFGQPAGFDLPQGVTYPSVDIYDENTKEVPLEKMVEMGKALIAIVRDYNPDIVCEVQINKAVMTVTILNSHGVRATKASSAWLSRAALYGAPICSLSAMAMPPATPYSPWRTSESWCLPSLNGRKTWPRRRLKRCRSSSPPRGCPVPWCRLLPPPSTAR